jgi:hypothetical protein
MEENETVKAIIDDKAIFCGKCGHKIATTAGLKCGLGNGVIYLVCKHKDGSKRCKALNQIDL